MTPIRTPEEFYARVDKTPGHGPAGDCWLWKKARGRYGRLTIDGKERMAHRPSWEIANGRPAPADLMIRHSCDTPACVRPDHLVLGTHQDNMDDMVRRHRARGGSLSPDDVLAMRRAWLAGRLSQLALARQYHVSQVAVGQICNGTAFRYGPWPEGGEDRYRERLKGRGPARFAGK